MKEKCIWAPCTSWSKVRQMQKCLLLYFSHKYVKFVRWNLVQFWLYIYRYVHIKNLPLIKITMVRKKCPITGLFITLSQQNRLLHFSTLSSHYMLLSSSHKTVDSVTNFLRVFLPQNIQMPPWNWLLFLEIKLAVPNN